MANDRMSRDLKAAAKIQETLLPREVPRVPGTDIAWIYRPCDELAGDGLNVIPLGNGNVGLYILDVSGHGVASALLSVTLSRLLSPPSEPSSILTRGEVATGPVRHHAARRGRLAPEPTLPIRPGDRAIRHVGLRDPRMCRPESSATSPPGTPARCIWPRAPIRFFWRARGSRSGWPTAAFEERSVRLGAGDRLYLYSDGVTEAMNPAGKQFGDARLLEAICQGRSEPLQESIATLLREIARWQGTERPQDDISVLAVEISIGSGLGESGHSLRPERLIGPNRRLLFQSRWTYSMFSRLRPHTPMSLGGLSFRQLAVGMWQRMEQHDAMTWAAAVAFYAMLATVPVPGPRPCRRGLATA